MLKSEPCPKPSGIFRDSWPHTPYPIPHTPPHPHPALGVGCAVRALNTEPMHSSIPWCAGSWGCVKKLVPCSSSRNLLSSGPSTSGKNTYHLLECTVCWHHPEPSTWIISLLCIIVIVTEEHWIVEVRSEHSSAWKVCEKLSLDV